MIISKTELIDVFENAYRIEEQMKDLDSAKKELKRQKDSSIKEYAKANEIDEKGMIQGYNSFKAYKEKKVSVENEDFFSILSIIEEHFSDESDNTEDSVSI